MHESLFWTFLWLQPLKMRKCQNPIWISSSSNKSRPGTRFKMCSRSWQYQRFEYHQKLLAQSWIGAFSKSTYLCFALSLFDINFHECRKRISLEFICGIQLKSNSAGVQGRIYSWNWVLHVSWKRIPWEFTCGVQGCWHGTPETNSQGIRFRPRTKTV